MRMELAAALHHSAGPETNDAVRSKKTVSSLGARRPGVLEDPRPPHLGVERAARPRSTGPSPLSDFFCGEVHDAALVAFLVRQSRVQRGEREEEERKKVELVKMREQIVETFRSLSAVASESRTPQQAAWLEEVGASVMLVARGGSAASSLRKRKKKRTKRRRRCASSAPVPCVVRCLGVA